MCRAVNTMNRPANEMKLRLQGLNLLDRALAATTDDEITAAMDTMSEEHKAAIAKLVGDEAGPGELRAFSRADRLGGGLENVAIVLSDVCLSDCIEQLGEHADNPTRAQLDEVLPGVVERHGVAITRLMLASVASGDAPAAPMLRRLLKDHETLALPKVTEPVRRSTPVAKQADPARDALREARKERRAKEQAEAKLRREQALRAKNRL